jgi:hypothetical protein
VTVVVPEVADAMAASRERRTVRRAAGRHRAPARAPARARHEGPSDILPSQVGAQNRTRGSQGGQGRAARARGSYSRQARYVASNASLVPGDRNFQGVILAEYVTAVLIMVIAPLASGNTSATGGASPYSVADIRRVVATSAIYFFLALGSGGNRGKYCAMLGGLVLLTILIAAANAGAINEFFMVLGSNEATGTGTAAGGADTTGPGGNG